MSDAPKQEQGSSRPLQAVVALLEQELERLQTELETLRLIRHPEQEALVRRAVQRIDLRLDRLGELQRMMKATGSVADISDDAPPATPGH